MKQITKLFVKAALMSVVGVAGAFSAWGVDIQDVINNSATSSNLGNTGTTSWANDFTITGTSGVTYQIHSMGTKNTSNALQWNANGYLYMKTTKSGYKLKSVSVTTAANKNIAVYAQNTAYSAAPSGTALSTLAATSSGATYEFISDYTYLALKGTASTTSITNITIVWEENDNSLLENDLTLNATSKSFDLADGDGQTFQLTNSGSADGGLTFTTSNSAVATVSAAGLITAVEEGTATITVTQAESATYQGGSANCTVTVSDTRYTVSDLTFTAACSGSGTADDSAEWTITSDGTESTFDNTSGIHYGTNSASVTYLQLSTSGIDGTIRKIKVNARDAQESAAITVTVGSTSFTCGGETSVTATNTSTEYLFTGTGSGAVIVRVARASSMTKAIYVKSVKVSYTPSTAPKISASDVDDVAYDATSGSIAYSITNATLDGVLTASTTSDWLSVGSPDGSAVPFTCSANSVSTPRSATVALTYTYNTSETVVKNVTVTQAAAPALYSTIPTLFAAATTTATSVLVTFDNWVVSGISTDGKSVYVTDNSGNGFVIYYSSDQRATYSAGKILSGTAVGCDLVLYNGFAELKNLDASDLSITAGGTVTPSNIALASLSGVNTGAVVSYEGLTCSVSGGKYYLTDGVTTIQVYNTLFAFDALESGKSYDITGVYQQYNSTKEILPRSAADIVESSEPSIVINVYTVDATSDESDGTLTVTYNNVVANSASDIVIQWFEEDGSTLASDPTWIEAEINGSLNVYYVIGENAGAARAAYFKLYGLDDSDNDVYSELVTISQAAFVPDYATLPFNWAGGEKNDLTALNGVSGNGLGSDYAAGNAPYRVKFDNDGDYILIKVNEKPEAVAVKIKKLGGAGETTIDIQASSDGENFTSIQTFTNSGTQNTELEHVTTNAFGSGDRYVRIYFNKPSSGSNIGIGQITIMPTTVQGSLNGGFYWASFFSGANRYTLPKGAQAFTMNSSSKQLYRLGTDGSVIPTNTAVIIISDSPSIALTKSDDATSITINGDDNVLVGSDTTVKVSGLTGTPYVLGIVGGTLGFYEYTGTNIPANKAYYLVND